MMNISNYVIADTAIMDHTSHRLVINSVTACMTTLQDRVANTLVRFDQCLSLPAVDSRWLPYR